MLVPLWGLVSAAALLLLALAVLVWIGVGSEPGAPSPELIQGALFDRPADKKGATAREIAARGREREGVSDVAA